RFRAPGPPVGLWLDQKLAAGTLWSTYVREIKHDKNATTFSFEDDEGGGETPAPDDAEAIAVLAAHFAPLGACARAEAARSRHFGGVTLALRWLPAGAIQPAQPKQPTLPRGGPARPPRAAPAPP